MSIRLELFRSDIDSDKQTIGELYVLNGDEVILKIWTLEKPWLNNRRNVSSIPCGDYELELWSSEAHPNCFHLKDVPNRDNILIHIGNYYTDSLGCILLGMRALDINGDAIKDVVGSRKALKLLNNKIRKEVSKGGVKIKIL
jgi:hypothetical protein